MIFNHTLENQNCISLSDASPEENYQTYWRNGAPLQRGKAEMVEIVKPEKEKDLR